VHRTSSFGLKFFIIGHGGDDASFPVATVRDAFASATPQKFSRNYALFPLQTLGSVAVLLGSVAVLLGSVAVLRRLSL
jgi:hypothetical protein